MLGVSSLEEAEFLATAALLVELPLDEEAPPAPLLELLDEDTNAQISLLRTLAGTLNAGASVRGESLKSSA